VKRPESNPLREALAQSQQVGSHPDSDLLAAFAEDGLLKSERDVLLAHLSVCAQCREVLSISAAPMAEPLDHQTTFVLTRPTHPPLRSWLPWVAMVAGIIAVCSAVLMHQRGSTNLGVTSSQIAKVAPREAIGTNSESTRQPPANAENKAAKGRGKTESGPSSRSRSSTAVPGISDGMIDQQNGEAPSAPVANQVIPEIAGATVGANGSTIRSQPAKAKALAQAGTNDAMVSVAPNEETYQSHARSLSRAHWRINQNGGVERSVDDQTWQPVLVGEEARMHVVSVFDGNVWVGGELGKLYHSSDDGKTWVSVRLQEKQGRDHTVVHIRFLTSQDGLVDSDDGVTWETHDGGRSWR